MTRRLRLLMVEDSRDDELLLLRELARGGYSVTHTRVESASAMRQALSLGTWDLVVSDWNLPDFSAPQALAIALESKHDLPFIIVSGVVGEDTAVQALKAGAHDFVVKERLARLLPAVDRELREAAIRRSERSAREALERSERLLRLVTDSVPDGIVAIGDGGEILVCNPATQRLLGPDAGNILADDAWTQSLESSASTDPESPALKRSPLARALGGETIEGEQLTHCRASSEESTQISVSARPMHDPHCQIRGAVAVLRDVTRERSLQQQLLVSDRMASMGMLAAGVAHEINNPLSSLVVNLKLAIDLAESVSSQFPGSQDIGEIQDVLRDAHEASERMFAIVRDIKVFCHSGGDETKPTELQPVLESAIRMAWGEIRHRAELVREYAPMPLVRASESRLCQVFLNLLVNAAQAIPEGCKATNQIHVRTRVAPDGRAVIEFRDSGPGIAPEVLQRLFTPFYSTKPAGVGTGLGLSISQRIVSTFGGEIKVESQPGQGALFQVYLDACDPIAATEPVRAASAPLPGARLGRILAVDDEPLVTNALRRMLGREHEFSSENRARAALERILAGERFDVILCDLMMPDMTGIDLLEELERAAPDQAAKIIFLTGGTFGETVSTFRSDLKNLCLEKPFGTSQLRSIVNSCIR